MRLMTLSWRFLGGLLLAGICLIYTAQAMLAEPAPVAEQRAAAQKLFKEGNIKDALAKFRELLADPKNDSPALIEDYRMAAQAMQRLAMEKDLDDLREKVLADHPQHWRVMQAIAYDYSHGNHYGFIIAGKFERGNHRGGGEWANVAQRDYVRALQIFDTALPLMLKDDNSSEKSEFCFALAQTLLSPPNSGAGWHFQILTDLKQLPDVEKAYYGRGGNSGAPVDAEGNPVYYSLPKSWEAAQNDGERWRWALNMAGELHAANLNRSRLIFAQFLQSQFGEQTMQQFSGWRGRGPVQDNDQKPSEDGPYAVHTLTDDETIAKLATGIKRFKLPEEYNYLAVYKKIADEPKSGLGDKALEALAQIYENRRQYLKAAEVWKRCIKEHGDTPVEHRKKRLDQIIGNWGRFENQMVQAAGRGAEVDFSFRNAKKVSFTAHALKFELLLDDVKAYIKSKPNRLEYQRLNISDIGQRIVQQNENKYLGEQVAEWELELKPAAEHYDRRITVSTPLQKSGAYLLTGKIADGNTTRIIVWLSDTAIVKYQLADKSLYIVADATTGAPVTKANVEFFGYQQRHIKNNDWQIDVKQFAEFSDAEGKLLLGSEQMPQGFQWLLIARTDDGRFAHFGFDHVWYNNNYDAEYNQTKVFTITDRPVYRPGDKVQYKFWVRKAKYDQPNASDFAKQTFALEIRNPKNEKVQSKLVTADEYGGITGEFELPKDATLGVYQLYLPAHGGGNFRVEEYKKPEYEVTIDAPTEPVQLGDKITATINAKYYFGAPVVNATVKYKVLRTAYQQRWYPYGPWDWFYGRGYWWFAYDYAWYPGWSEWGCKRPGPWWFPAAHVAPEVILDAEAKIGADGQLKIDIDTAPAKAVHGNQDHSYAITAEVIDESRRTIVGTGNVLVARKPFQVTAWVDRGYYRTGDTVKASFMAQTLANKPVSGKGQLALYKISYDKDGKPSEARAELWNLDTDTEGKANQQFIAAAPGQYRLSYMVSDAKEHSIEGGYIFNVVGSDNDSDKYRFEHLELIPDRREYEPGQKVKLLINTARPDSTVYLFVRPANSVYVAPRVLKLQGKSTTVEIDVVPRDMPNFFVEAMTVSGGRVHSETKEIVVPPEKRILNIAIDPSSKEYKPGQKATVKVRLTDHTGENFVGSTVVAIYDKAVEYISGGSNVGNIKEYFWKWRRHHYPRQSNNLSMVFTQLLKLKEYGMSQLGVFGYLQEARDELASAKSGGKNLAAAAPAAPGAAEGGGFGRRAMMDANGMADGADKKAEMSEKQSGDRQNAQGGAGGELVQPTVRSNFADTALWVGALTTKADGTAEVELTMPENLSTWRIKVWGMGHGTKVGEGSSDVVTNKDVIVRLQAPRFFVEKDEVVLSANVHNYLKSKKSITVKLDLPGEFLALMDGDKNKLSRVIEVAAGGEERVDWRVKVRAEGEATVRMSALTDEDSDATEQKFPVYVHGMLKMESFSGMLRPKDESGKLTFTVPTERRPEQSRVEIRYSPTLAGACVDALPYLASYPYGCTEQTLNRFVPTVVTQKILQRMKLDLAAIKQKRTNLNAQELGDPMKRAEQWQKTSHWQHNPVFDNDEVTKMVKDGVQRLTEMQLSDGGWGWFSGFGEHSYPHTTAVVVHGLQLAKSNDVALVPGLLERGVDWLKRYEAEQVERLKRGDLVREKKEGWKDIHNYKLEADNLDALVYYVLSDADHKNNAMNAYLYRDRTHLAVYAKALFGLGLHKHQDQEKLDMILRNIAQFVVVDDENQTAYLKLPQDNWWWSWYGSEVEAHSFYLKLLSAAEPKSEVAPKLVKYLLNNRKHATYWNSTRDSAYAIEALADYMKASGEDTPDMTVEVLVDGKRQKEVRITAQDLFTVDNTVVLAGNEVTAGPHTVELKKTGKGPLYYNAYVTNFTLEDDIKRAGLEVKVNRKFYKLKKVDKEVAVSGARGQAVNQKVEKYERVEIANDGELKSGDLLEVELEIDSKNDYEYILFEDLKAAGCEAVEVRSGYNGNSMGAYVEFRDNRVGFFIRALARGKHSVSYKLRAEIPGRFSALPAKASAMYAPELQGNSDEMKLKIVE
jgi:uncharacterized protein YfaS (alpha-2-macroglobulin family)